MQAGQVDNRGHAVHGRAKRVRLQDVAFHRLHPVGVEPGAVAGLADQGANLVAIVAQRLDDEGAEVPSRAGDQDLHVSRRS